MAIKAPVDAQNAVAVEPAAAEEAAAPAAEEVADVPDDAEAVLAECEQPVQSTVRDKGFALFCKCLCGSAASLHKLEHMISALQVETLITPDGDGNSAPDAMYDQLVLKGYCGLLGLVNENPALLPIDSASKDRSKALLLEAFELLAVFPAAPARPDGCAHAQYLMGECHDYGSRDSAKAIAWFRLAAEQEHAPALCELGYAYHNGEGIDECQTKGVQLYRRAAEQGYAKAQYYMGVCYYYGQGVEAKEVGEEGGTTPTSDKEEAVRWYQLAADQGYAPAQSNLGFCYRMGLGVADLDMQRAQMYFELAAQQGDSYAISMLSNMTF